MESAESGFEDLRHMLTWMGAFFLALIIFVTVYNLLEPNGPTAAECPAGQTCWDLRSM